MSFHNGHGQLMVFGGENDDEGINSGGVNCPRSCYYIQDPKFVRIKDDRLVGIEVLMGRRAIM